MTILTAVVILYECCHVCGSDVCLSSQLMVMFYVYIHVYGNGVYQSSPWW